MPSLFTANRWREFFRKLLARGGGTRGGAILAFFATSLANRGIGVACQFLQVPIALTYLGGEAFGVWAILAQVNYLLTFSDLGIGVGAQNQISEALGVGDRARARRIFSTSAIALFGIAVALAAILTPCAWMIPWQHTFKLTDPNVIQQVPPGMIAFALIPCLCIPLGLGQRLAYGMQMGWLINAGQAATSVLSLGGVILGAYLKLNFRDFVIVTWSATLLVNVVLFAYVTVRMGLPGREEVWFDRGALRGLLGLGAMFAVQQVSNVMLFSAPPLIISILLGAGAVAPYVLIQRIFNIPQMIQNAFVLPLWPAYADAKARQDWAWMERTLRRSIKATLLAAILPMLAIPFVIHPIIQLWTRGLVSAPADLVSALLLWNIVSALQQPLGFFLAGVSEVKRYTLQTVYTTIASGVLMLALGHFCGAAGVIFGLSAGFVPFALRGAVTETVRYLDKIRALPSLPPVGESMRVPATVH